MSDTNIDQQRVLNCWFLTGATCSGKSSAALHLAKSLNAEIISMDSMAVYSEMNIGTAKPSDEARSQIPHHMIDIRKPNESFSVSQFREKSLELIQEIESRDKKVLFVGGTPLYLKTLLRGLFDGPSADWEFRNSVSSELEKLDRVELRKRLELVDPLAAHNIHPNDVRRMIRAIEVFATTGQPLSHQQVHFDHGTEPEKCKVFVIGRERSILHTRIETRVDQMFKEGFVDEVKQILDKYGDLGKTAKQAVGYQEIAEFLNDQRDFDSTVERTKVRTRQFARRQETWFRGLKECRWVKVTDQDDSESITTRILEMAE